jgi:hypothetical protein
VASAKCMRAHGWPDFPDPATNPPSNKELAAQHLGIFSDHGGVVFALPWTVARDISSPAFQRAEKTCGLS